MLNPVHDFVGSALVFGRIAQIDAPAINRAANQYSYLRIGVLPGMVIFATSAPVPPLDSKPQQGDGNGQQREANTPHELPATTVGVLSDLLVFWRIGGRGEVACW